MSPSCAALTFIMAWSTNDWTPIKGVVSGRKLILGNHPIPTSKGANPVLELLVEFTANSVRGILDDQLLWSASTTVRSTAVIFLTPNSDIPSVCGWYAVDMSSLVPISLFNSCQNNEMNLESRSDTIDSGVPNNRMISLRYRAAISLAVDVVRHLRSLIIPDSWHIATNR